MIRTIISLLMIMIGAIVMIAFNQYKGTAIPYPLLFFLLGMIMTLSGLWILFRVDALFERVKHESRLRQTIRHLEQHGEKIVFDPSACEIKENSYSEERDIYSEDEVILSEAKRNIMALDALTDESRNTKRVQVNHSVLVHRHIHNGKEEVFYSPLIPKDRITLMFLLENKKEGCIYVDRNDRRVYYFDLRFLDNFS
jgi:hypothetical protein